jgi:hypothetical protein
MDRSSPPTLPPNCPYNNIWRRSTCCCSHERKVGIFWLSFTMTGGWRWLRRAGWRLLIGPSMPW